MTRESRLNQVLNKLPPSLRLVMLVWFVLFAIRTYFYRVGLAIAGRVGPMALHPKWKVPYRSEPRVWYFLDALPLPENPRLEGCLFLLLGRTE